MVPATTRECGEGIGRCKSNRMSHAAGPGDPTPTTWQGWTPEKHGAEWVFKRGTLGSGGAEQWRGRRRAGRGAGRDHPTVSWIPSAAYSREWRALTAGFSQRATEARVRCPGGAASTLFRSGVALDQTQHLPPTTTWPPPAASRSWGVSRGDPCTQARSCGSGDPALGV